MSPYSNICNILTDKFTGKEYNEQIRNQIYEDMFDLMELEWLSKIDSYYKQKRLWIYYETIKNDRLIKVLKDIFLVPWNSSNINIVCCKWKEERSVVEILPPLDYDNIYDNTPIQEFYYMYKDWKLLQLTIEQIIEIFNI